MQTVAAFLCGNDLLVDLCANAFYTINGGDMSNFNRSIVPVNVAHSAATTSTWVYAQLAQMVATNRYGMMDFGERENIRRYGSNQPPAYPLGNISSPNIALFRGMNDPLADETDVERLVNDLNGKLRAEQSFLFAGKGSLMRHCRQMSGLFISYNSGRTPPPLQ